MKRWHTIMVAGFTGVLLLGSVQFITYALWAGQAAQFLVANHASEVSKQFHGNSTKRLCILKSSFCTLTPEAQEALLDAAKAAFENVYVGFDAVPEDVILYAKWEPDQPVLYENSTVFTREIVNSDMNLYPRQIVDGGWFYWEPSESRTGIFRLGMWFCTDYQHEVQQYIWILGRWVKAGEPSLMHGDLSQETWKTLPEWRSERTIDQHTDSH